MQNFAPSPQPRTIAIVPCGGSKLDHAAPASELYTGQQFRHALAAAAEIDDQVEVLILSAKHGLVRLDTILEPYDLKLGDEGSIDPCDIILQADALGLTEGRCEVYGLLPRAYYQLADEALSFLGIWLQDIYEADAGIGYQRGTCSTILRTAAA